MGKRGPAPGSQRIGGRQKGTPNKATRELKELAQTYTPEAVKELAALAGLIEGKAGAQSEAARVSAINSLLDRGHGKAPQAVALTDADGEGPARIIYEWAASRE